MPWKSYEPFAPAFLETLSDLILQDLFHQIKAFLLFPPNCACDGNCTCKELREKVVLSLNTHLFNRLQEQKENLERLYAIKILLKVPEDSFFRKHYGDAYPLWLIQEKLKKRDRENHFKIISRLVWTLLRLGKSYEFFFGRPETSLNEAIDMILGNNPLKTKVVELKQADYLCGEKGYSAYFKKYKPVCHFIAALDMMKKEKKGVEDFLFGFNPSKDQLDTFLSLSHWFRTQLLPIRTQNIKEKKLFLERDLLPLPSWIESKKIDLPIKPIEDKVQEIKERIKGPFDPVKKCRV